MSTWRKWLPGALGVTAILALFAFLLAQLVLLDRELFETREIRVEGTFQYAALPLTGRNIALTDEGTYVYYSIIGSEPIQTSENSWTYEHEVFHAGWYTVDGRIVTLEDTEGNLHQAVYTQDILYLMDADGQILEMPRIYETATYIQNTMDALPSPRPS